MRMIAPPGFPTLLAPLMLFGDLPLLAVRIFNLACWVTSSVLTYLLFRRRLGRNGAWWAAALTATSPALAAQSTMLLSESAYLTLALGILFLHDQRFDPGKSLWKSSASLGLLCAAATLVRAMGIVLAPIIALAILTRRFGSLRRRAAHAALFVVAFMTPIFVWQIRQSAYPAGNSYGNAWLHARPWENTNSTGLALQWNRLAHFGPIRLRDIKSVLLPPQLGWRAYQEPIAPIASWLIGGSILVVTFWRCWRSRAPADFFVLATLGMLCLWPYDEGPRMVAPLLPLFFAYIVWAAQRASNVFPGNPLVLKSVSIALAAFLVVHFCELARSQTSMANQRTKSLDRLASMHRMQDWQERHLPVGVALSCVIRPRQDIKTILIGGSYLSRRHVVKPMDLDTLDKKTFDAIDTPFCFVESALVPLNPPVGCSPFGRAEGFVVYIRNVRVTHSQSPAAARRAG
jgi:4-amino-4-deoxy-L-arabinose transferase-like glycosyltransferase